MSEFPKLKTLEEIDTDEVNDITDEELHTYYTNEAIESAGEFELRRMYNQVKNTKFLKAMGLPTKTPAAIKRQSFKRQPVINSDSSDSDEEWKPSTKIEKPPDKKSTKKGKKVNQAALENNREEDEYIYCYDCNDEFYGDCPQCGPMDIVEDEPTADDGSDPNRSFNSAPKDLVEIRKSTIEEAGKGSFAASNMWKGMRFGPYCGKMTRDLDVVHESGYAWQIYKNVGRRTRIDYIDATDDAWANWMKFVNCARFEEEQNLAGFQYKGKIYYSTLGDIPKGQELLVWYGKEYAEELGIRDIHKRRTRATTAAKSNNKTDTAGPQETVTADRPRKAIRVLPNNRKRFPVKHEITGASVYRCDIEGCTISYSRCCHLNEHQRSAHGVFYDRTLSSTSAWIHCQSCNFSSSSQVTMDRHTQEKHHTSGVHQPAGSTRSASQGARPKVRSGGHPCNLCHKVFDHTGNLAQHLLTHTGEKPHKCPVCGKGFTRRSSVKKHERTHSGVKPYVCDVCSRGFNQSQSLTKHKLKHTGEKPYICPTCGKGFTQSGAVIRHMRSHTGETPFTCPTCGKGFTQSGAVIRHMRSHTGETPFTCPTCGKGFTQSGDLTKHIRIHTGEKPYMCPVCGRGFTQKCSLTSHQRNKH